MDKCGNCKFFGDEIIYDDCEYPTNTLTPTGFFACDRIKFADEYFERCEATASEKAITVDASSCFAALRVKEDFGCVLFESK